MRVIKTQDDIELMKIAGRITESAFADTLKALRQGMTELEIVEEVNYQLRKHGSLGQSFTTSLYNSGPNHPLLFGQRMESWHRKLDPPVSILFDFGGIYQGWCYDFGRTVFFGRAQRRGAARLRCDDGIAGGGRRGAQSGRSDHHRCGRRGAGK